jgi:hypothetical protein
VSLLGLVDDMIGVTYAGYRAQQMNAIINVKTAEKRLQFGVTKCKSMLISRNPENIQNSYLSVDNWKTEHKENMNTGETDLVETFEGLVTIDKTEEHKYLGFVISSKGNNMININSMKKKSIWIIRKIFTKLDSLNLRKYYFECAMLFLNVMLRSSILYAGETYYNLKEVELRQIERIEEDFLRKLFKTSRGCPISQLYLETGHTPARFAISKMRLLFLKCILHEKPDCMILKFLNLQFENPSKGDWASTCLKDLKDLKINMSLEDIKQITKTRFTKMINEAINQKALEYLNGKKGSKGGEISYTKIKLADYLSPTAKGLSIDDKRYIFSMRNRMVILPENFPLKEQTTKCVCGENKENMEHVYICKQWTNEITHTNYNLIFEDDIKQITEVYGRFRNNYEIRKTYIDNQTNGNQSHVISVCDPLFSVLGHSNGNKS